MITTTYALDCFRWNCFLQNVDCKIRFPRMKDISYLIYRVYQIVKCLSIFLSIIFAFPILFLMLSSYVSSSPEVLFPRRTSPSPKVLSLTRLSYLSAWLVAKYNLTSQRALGDFARGALPRPFEPPAFESPERYLYFALRLCMFLPFPFHAHGMPMICAFYGHGM